MLVLLLEWCVRFGAGLLVLLRVLLLEWRVRFRAAGAARVLLQGVAVSALWSWHVGATAGCGCRVLLSKGCLHLGYCCQSAVCAMNLGCRCRCREWLRDVYGSVCVGP